MSRKPISANAYATDGHTAAPSAFIPDDVCPVCRRQKYFNPDLSFLINPECYHPMCMRCVDFIFGKGPAQCPHPGCTKTLRQRGFHAAFFKDLKVEREVDVRRRVQAVFNNTEDDFVSLQDYNDYLQQVEELTFDLVQGGEAERRGAEKKLVAYEQKHREEIEKNRRRGRDAEAQRKQREAAEAEAARQRRLEEQREEERARAEEATTNAEVMEALARGEPGTAAEIQARIVAQKRARVAAIAGSRFPSLARPTNLLSIRGLKDRSAPQAADDDADQYYLRPYDPFAGLDLTPTRYALPPATRDLPNPWLDRARESPDHHVPGYSTHEYVARSLFDAFAGLGLVVGKGEKDDDVAAKPAAAKTTVGGVKARGRMTVDDVF
ncbi:CDK-activating kinase assembly factor MAT1-domain-containing protein [Jackrogersella minutella]|nr:CDK-activating kinase assembly factor MAT1-domain-containing protein [Jackrogersella minutella]